MRKILLIILTISLFSCSKDDDTSANGSKANVRYRVECNSCSIEYSDKTGTKAVQAIKNKWEIEFEGLKGQRLYIFVGGYSGAAQIIKAYIIVNGEQKAFDLGENKHIDISYNLPD